MVLAEYGLCNFLEKGCFSSPNDRLGCMARSASYSVSNSRSFPRGKRPVLEANHTHLVPRLRMNETVGLHVSAFAYAFIGLLLFLLFRAGSSLSPCHLFFYIQQTFILKGIALYNATL